MASELAQILTNLAAMTVTVPAAIAADGSNKTPEVLYLSTLPAGALAAAALPKRLIRMMRSADAAAQAFQLQFGNDTSARVPWRVYDVLLWRELRAGQGVGSHEADLVKYAAAYVDALQAAIGPDFPTSRSRILNVTMLVEAINYPFAGDAWYAGVEVALDIEERLPSTNPSPFS